jgi:hypothetical protein
VRFIARLSARFGPRCRPGVSTKAIWQCGQFDHAMARRLWLATTQSFCLSAFSASTADVGPHDQRDEARPPVSLRQARERRLVARTQRDVDLAPLRAASAATCR